MMSAVMGKRFTRMASAAANALRASAAERGGEDAHRGVRPRDRTSFSSR